MKPIEVISQTGRVHVIGGGRVFVTAEIGQNHNGDVYLASRLVQLAEKGGASGVKFCKRDISEDMAACMRDMPYDGPQSYGSTYGEHRAKLEFTERNYEHLVDRHRYNGNESVFFMTVCDLPSLEVGERLGIPMYKIASRDLDNEPLLRAVARTDKPVIVSTGMHSLMVLDAAIETLQRKRTVALHCVSAYPTLAAEVNLPRMMKIRKRYGIPFGLSDHTIGTAAAISAVALGASMIEKHFTKSRSAKGTDHAVSLTPREFGRMVYAIRAVEKMRQPASVVVASKQSRLKLGRSLVSRLPIRCGEVITSQHLTLKSPGAGLRYSDRDRIIGHVAARDIPEDSLIHADDVR